MKILIGALAHETNSFCAETISFDAWMKNGYREGEEIREKYENHPHAIGGMLQALEDDKAGSERRDRRSKGVGSLFREDDGKTACLRSGGRDPFIFSRRHADHRF